MGDAPPVEVHPLSHRTRVSVDEPALDGVWLVHLPGTTADPSIFPPDRALSSLAFDFSELTLDEPEPPDPFAVFHNALDEGLTRALRKRAPRHLVFVGHSFGGMLGVTYLIRRSLGEFQAQFEGLEKVTLVMVGTAHTSPLDRFRIRSGARLVGPLATWLSHYVTLAGTSSRERMARFKELMGRAPPQQLWRKAMATDDELGMCADMPRASTLDHFWSVVCCAKAYDLPALLATGAELWFDLLILSAEYDAQWPADMFDEFWPIVEASNCPRARWCHFPGDDHMSVARFPTKYYKEIKDFLLSN